MKKRSFRAEREFGLIVGGIFALLGAWWLYRGKFTNVAQIMAALGLLLVMLGLVFPRVLIYPNKAWMLLAEVLAFVSTRIILGIVFFFIVTPIGFIKRLMGWDPLSRRARSSGESHWKPYSERQRDPRHFEKMY
jgi:hypothetical protein